MGTENKGQFLHKPKHLFVAELEASFEGLKKHTPFDYLQSGSVVRPSLYIHPINGMVFDLAGLVSNGVIIEQELRRRFNEDQITTSPGRNMGESFMFPQFTIVGIEGFEEISGLIYPTEEYARQVVEDDVLMFESYAFPPGSSLGRSTLQEEIERKKKEFPKFEIPFVRLNEVLAET